MTVKCKIEFELKDEEAAKAVLRSIEMDNGPYASAEVTGGTLVLTAEAKSMPSMLHTLDDLLACVKVAEGMVKLK
ncbi:MAG: KEOPS complex subunit Pcc1 [Methanomassiliicoccales archaeon]|jgi:tRNA threonylcarbamoyladenosine modification (KEOPS) complex  Pcc1 subunit